MWLGEDEVARGLVKIKSLSLHEEVMIERKELVDRVREQIAANPVLLSKEEQQNVIQQKPKQGGKDHGGRDHGGKDQGGRDQDR